MNTAQFAMLVEGRAVGLNRFQARCPAHSDHSPSLSIAEGQDGRILLHCFAGCSTDSILSMLNLTRRDLFQGPPPSPAQLAAIQAERQASDQRKRLMRRSESEAWSKARRWDAVVAALGSKLAHTPDEAAAVGALTRAYHDACNKWHEAETSALRASEERTAA